MHIAKQVSECSVSHLLISITVGLSSRQEMKLHKTATLKKGCNTDVIQMQYGSNTYHMWMHLYFNHSP